MGDISMFIFCMKYILLLETLNKYTDQELFVVCAEIMCHLVSESGVYRCRGVVNRVCVLA